MNTAAFERWELREGSLAGVLRTMFALEDPLERGDGIGDGFGAGALER